MMYSKPEWVVYHASGIGWLDNTNAHASSQISLQSFDKGFFESGTGGRNTTYR